MSAETAAAHSIPARELFCLLNAGHAAKAAAAPAKIRKVRQTRIIADA
jgi:hypothetical protein